MSSHKSSIFKLLRQKLYVLYAISSYETSCGYDGLSHKVLKLCSNQIFKPITYIYNKSLTCGICPNCLNYANLNHVLRKVTNQKYQIIDLFLYWLDSLKYVSCSFSIG